MTWSLQGIPTAEACSPDFIGHTLGAGYTEDDRACVRAPDGTTAPDPVTRALADLPVGERHREVKGLTTLAAEEADARRWFRNPESVARYLAFVRDPLREEPPPRTPRAAQLYRQAVGRMHANDLAGAREGFRKVLALPRKEGRWRSAWAAWMLGNLSWHADPHEAAEHYARVRALVRGRAHDPLGLAHASLGWEAGMRRGWDDAEAVRLCHAAGGTQCVDEDTVERTLALPEAQLLQAAAHPWLATGVTAWLAFEADPVIPDDPARVRALDRWLAAVERARGKVARPTAAAMAHAAYARGEWQRAAAWARQGDPRDPRIADVRGRLARRAGDARGVVAALSPLRKLSLTHGSWLGEAQLDLGMHTQAMQTFLRAGSWLDAAFLAERVLTVEELERAIPRMPGVDSGSWQPDRFYAMSVELLTDPECRYGYCEDPSAEAEARGLERRTRLSLRALLARRLARMGRWDAAAKQFRLLSDALPADHPFQDLGARATAAAKAWGERSRARTPHQTATATLAFFDAVAPRRFDLFATEGFPDFAAWDGQFFSETDLAASRIAGSAPARERERLLASIEERWPGDGLAPDGQAGTEALIAALDDVLREDDSETPTPTHLLRHHARWPLARLAWNSGRGLPDGDPLLVQLLCRGGRLLRNRAVDAADVYYKRLVWKGRPDPVAQVADNLRWFPQVNEETGACLATPWPPPPPPQSAAQLERAEAEERLREERERLREAQLAALEAERAEHLSRAQAQRAWMSALAFLAMLAVAGLFAHTLWERARRRARPGDPPTPGSSPD